jgi:membrane fusion protein, multidrug efflux system
MSQRSYSRLRIVFRAGTALMLLALLVFGPQWFGTKGQASASAEDTLDAIAIRAVRVESRQDAAPRSSITADGTLRPRRRATLSFAVDGVITDWIFDDGEEVAAGEVLARLDAVPFESAVVQARARTDYLEKSLERSRRLKDQKALSEEEFDAQDAELRAAQATLRLAQWRMERSQLRAPFAGLVRRRHVESGEVVAPGAAAYELIATDELEVDLAVGASDLGRIDLDAPIRIVVPGVGSATAHVDHAPIESDTRSGTVPLRAVIDNTGRTLLPGLVARAEFGAKTSSSLPHVVLPLSALRIADDGGSVWRIEHGRVRRVEVRTGPVRSDVVEILSGVRVGDLVVDHAPDSLREGDAVRLVGEVQR